MEVPDNFEFDHDEKEKQILNVTKEISLLNKDLKKKLDRLSRINEKRLLMENLTN
jgi:hypothetical protein